MKIYTKKEVDQVAGTFSFFNRGDKKLQEKIVITIGIPEFVKIYIESGVDANRTPLEFEVRPNGLVISISKAFNSWYAFIANHNLHIVKMMGPGFDLETNQVKEYEGLMIKYQEEETMKNIFFLVPVNKFDLVDGFFAKHYPSNHVESYMSNEFEEEEES